MAEPRFAPIVEKPVRTVAAYRARKAQAARRAVNEALRAYVEKQKGENHESDRQA